MCIKFNPMKNISFLLVVFVASVFSLNSCIDKANATTNSRNKVVTTESWTSLENAIDNSQKNNKKIIVDVYTDWCKWCKVMDEKTFKDPDFKKFVNENYNTAKLNAEQKEVINFKGKDYNWIKGNRKGQHELAIELLDGQLAYPSIVVLDADLNKLEVIRGYKSAEDLKRLLNNI